MATVDAGSTLSTAGTGATVGFAVGGPIGAAIGFVGGALIGAFGGGKAARRKKKAKRLQKALSRYTYQRQRFAAIRGAKAQEAAVSMSMAATGATGASSAYQGAQAGLRGSMEEELKFNALAFQRIGRIQQLQAKAARDQQLMQTGNAALSALAPAFGGGPPSPEVGLKTDGSNAPIALPKFDRSSLNLEPSIKFPSQG